VTYDWTLFQTLCFIIAPFFVMLALASEEDDDDDQGGGNLSPAYYPVN
tara:strand:+ start:414 stop:557 length:144 start_codon:yes stop_codon:yes gene_type:complete